MAVEQIINSIEYRNQYINGVDFLSNPGEFNLNLAGSVMELIQCIQEIDVSWSAEASASFKYKNTALGGGLYEIERPAGSFFDDGFANGDLIDWDYNPGSPIVPSVTEMTVQTISDLKIRIQSTGPDPAIADNETAGTILYGKTAITALIYGTNLIDNSETGNISSKVSGTDSAFYAAGITGSDTPMTPQGSYRGWKSGTASVKKLANPSTYVQRFELTNTFLIAPWYLEGELSNLQDGILPDLYAGQNSLKHYYTCEFLTVLSNPNTSKKATHEQNLGSVGWFGENFNGFADNYSIVSIDYEDAATAASTEGLQIANRTKASIVLSKTGGSFTAGQKLGVLHSYLPDQDEYQETTTDMVSNFLYDSMYFAEGSPGSAAGIIKSATASLNAGNLIIDVEFEYTVPEQTRLSSLSNYLIAIVVADDALSAGNSDKVVLLADARLYDFSADIPDLMDFDKFEIFQHNLDILTDQGYSTWEGWNEDGIVIDFDFWLDLSKSAVLNTLDFTLSAYNTISGDSWELDSFSWPIAGAVISGGVQQFFIDTTRGYPLAAADQFNFVKMNVGSQVGDLQHYTGQWAQKISWQDWIQNLDTDTIFFDNTKPNDNFNLKSSNYSELNDYEIRLIVKANVAGVSVLGDAGNTDYQFISQKITINDYDLPTDWTAEIKTFRASNMQDLGGAILTNEDTLFKIIWTRTAGDPTDITDFWAIHRIEVTDQNGYNIEELSTIQPFPSTQLLQPLTGETQLKMSLVSGKVETECLIKGTGDAYNISGRLSNGVPGSPPADVKLTSSGAPKNTSGGVNFKIIS